MDKIKMDSYKWVGSFLGVIGGVLIFQSFLAPLFAQHQSGQIDFIRLLAAGAFTGLCTALGLGVGSVVDRVLK